MVEVPTRVASLRREMASGPPWTSISLAASRSASRWALRRASAALVSVPILMRPLSNRLDDKSSRFHYRENNTVISMAPRSRPGGPEMSKPFPNNPCAAVSALRRTLRRTWLSPRLLRGDDASEGDGYLVSLVYDTDRNISDFVVLDAEDISRGPVARAEFPARVPFGFHGNWRGAK
ncbi:MAG: carotenoid oxygenase family protein [Parvibaculum sp.]|nr:carotenoid oxygenase family protein [Parvibaculum sp.]